MSLPPWLRSQRVRTTARWSFGIAVVAVVAFSLDLPSVGARLLATDLRLAAIGIAGLTATHLIGAATWRLLVARISDRRPGWWRSATRYYAAQAIGGVTPANLGGDAYRVHALRSDGEGLGAALGSVVIQRATSYLALSFLGGAALVYLSIGASVPGLLALAAGGVAVTGAVVAGLALFAPAVVARLPIKRLIESSGEIDARHWRRIVVRAAGEGVALGMLFHVVGVLLTALLVLAVTHGTLPLAAVAAIAVARLSLAVPLSPSGLGLQEGALSVLFVGIGLAPETALAALLLARLSLLATTLIGVGAMLADGIVRRRDAASPSGRKVSAETVVR